MVLISFRVFLKWTFWQLFSFAYKKSTKTWLLMGWIILSTLKDGGHKSGALQRVWPAYRMQGGRGEEGGTSWSAQREGERRREGAERRGRELLRVSSAEELESSRAAANTHLRYVPDRLVQVREVMPLISRWQTHPCVWHGELCFLSAVHVCSVCSGN